MEQIKQASSLIPPVSSQGMFEGRCVWRFALHLTCDVPAPGCICRTELEVYSASQPCCSTLGMLVGAVQCEFHTASNHVAKLYLAWVCLMGQCCSRFTWHPTHAVLSPPWPASLFSKTPYQGAFLEAMWRICLFFAKTLRREICHPLSELTVKGLRMMYSPQLLC